MTTVRHLLDLLSMPCWPSVAGTLGVLFFFFLLYEPWRYALMVENVRSPFWHVVVTGALVFPSVVVFAVMVYADLVHGHVWRNLGVALLALALRNAAAGSVRLVRRDWEGLPLGFTSLWVPPMVLVTVVLALVL